MWLVIKTKQKDIPNLKNEIEKKFGGNLNVYFPKFKIESKNKLSIKNLLKEVFFHHSKFSYKRKCGIIKLLKRYFYYIICQAAINYQTEINVSNSMQYLQAANGFISSDFFELKKLNKI